MGGTEPSEKPLRVSRQIGGELRPGGAPRTGPGSCVLGTSPREYLGELCPLPALHPGNVAPQPGDSGGSSAAQSSEGKTTRGRWASAPGPSGAPSPGLPGQPTAVGAVFPRAAASSLSGPSRAAEAAVRQPDDLRSSRKAPTSLTVRRHVARNHHGDAGSGLNGSKETIDRC